MGACLCGPSLPAPQFDDEEGRGPRLVGILYLRRRWATQKQKKAFFLKAP